MSETQLNLPLLEPTLEPSERAANQEQSYAGVTHPRGERFAGLTGPIQELNKEVYHSQWTSALRWLAEHNLSPEEIRDMLQFAATEVFGFWQLEDETLDELVGEVLGTSADGVLPRAARTRARMGFQSHFAHEGRKHNKGQSFAFPPSSSSKREPRCRWCSKYLPEKMHTLFGVFLVLATCGFGQWFVWQGSQNPASQAILDYMGRAPLYAARATAGGACLITGLLFLTMSRSCLTACRFVNCCCTTCSTVTAWFVDNHKEIHIVSAICVLVAAAAHTFAHLLFVVPMLSSSMHSLDLLNNITKCTQCAMRGHCKVLLPRFLEFPPCPFEHRLSYYDVVLGSTTGITGILLWVVLIGMWYFSRRKQRTTGFNCFQHVHTVGMVLWLLLLWLHGANQWVGASFPIVLAFSFPSLPFYVYDRCGRWSGSTIAKGELRGVVLRTSYDDDNDDAVGGSKRGGTTAIRKSGVELMRIRVSVTDHFVSNFRSGMYAQLQVPALSSIRSGMGSEWHPFTICSGDHSRESESGQKYIEFIIAAVGDWTQGLLDLTRQAQTVGLVQNVSMESAPDEAGSGGSTSRTDDGESKGEGKDIMGMDYMLRMKSSSKLTTLDFREEFLMLAASSSRGSASKRSHTFSLQENDHARIAKSETGFASRSRSVRTTKNEISSPLHRTLLISSSAEEEKDGENEGMEMMQMPARITVNTAGPYSAPTLSAKNKNVLIVVGGGVGITPFLSYLETLVSLDSESRTAMGQLPDAAHFFWTTRSADDLLFAWPLLQRILSSNTLRERIFLHIHVTTRLPKGNAPAMLFREAIARQNKRIKSDLAAWQHLPRSWSNNDVMLCRVTNAHGIPIAFGRPNFTDEFYFVGKNHLSKDVSVYACGNTGLVETLQRTVKLSNQRNKKRGATQRFHFHHERFD